jgi:DNA-binding SARP family transcriptional activator
VTAAADVDEAAVEGSAGMDEGDEEAAEELAEDAVDDEIDRSDVPWVLRRDAVKDDRPHVHQLFVRDDTDGRARRAESRLEERLDMDVYRLDAREAIYLVGMDHLDEVAELLEEWGYNF